ncbi:MAG: sodium:proton antiporter [Epsilonproteobacteria bacterium]|nr:sodium:proton antiporter [Campylobacterota bacterium]
MALIQKSGGIGGFVEFMLHKAKLVRSQRSALMLSYAIGIFIFIESSITSLIAGAVGKPFCDKYKIPYAKLAFVCDSTSAPVSSLIVLNGWGALLLGLISTQIATHSLELDAITLLVDAVLHNFYAMSALVVTFLSIWFDINIGSMKTAQYKNINVQSLYVEIKSMYYMLLPIILMVFLVFVFLYISGNGDILKGSGSTSIFYTVLTTLIFMFIYYVKTDNMSITIWLKTALKGAKHLFPIAMILLFAFAIGDVTSKLKVGEYLASLASANLDMYLLAPIIFLLSSIISFSTGTSWGTFSIMIPVAMPMAIGMDASLSLCVGAVISGGIFGDHCSPISDTTIISSMASECEVVEHVKTQFPYALISALIAFLLFFIFGFNIS